MKFLGFEEVKSELVRLKKENEELKKEIKQLAEKITIKPPEPMPVVYGCSVGAVGKNGLTKEEVVEFKDSEKSISSILNQEKDHKCTPECFGKHVIKAIQNDYDSINFKNTISKHRFTHYWYEKLSVEYPWLKGLHIIDSKIYFSN